MSSIPSLSNMFYGPHSNTTQSAVVVMSKADDVGALQPETIRLGPSCTKKTCII